MTKAGENSDRITDSGSQEPRSHRFKPLSRDVGKKFPEKYMEWYRGYQNDMSALLILDANGFDRVAVGDPVPDPNVGKRIAPSRGLVINDEEGFERSGYGLLKVENHYRVVLGLDNAQGQEGASLFLIDDGPVGLELQDGSGHRDFTLHPKGKK